MVAVECKALDHYNRFNRVFFQFSNYRTSTVNKNINKPYCNSPFAFLNDNYPLDYTKVTRGTYSLFRTEFFSAMATWRHTLELYGEDITRFYAEQQKPNWARAGRWTLSNLAACKKHECQFCELTGIHEKKRIALHLVRNAISAINGIISPSCANLGIIVTRSPENRSQPEEKSKD